MGTNICWWAVKPTSGEARKESDEICQVETYERYECLGFFEVEVHATFEDHEPYTCPASAITSSELISTCSTLQTSCLHARSEWRSRGRNRNAHQHPASKQGNKLKQNAPIALFPKSKSVKTTRTRRNAWGLVRWRWILMRSRECLELYPCNSSILRFSDIFLKKTYGIIWPLWLSRFNQSRASWRSCWHSLIKHSL